MKTLDGVLRVEGYGLDPFGSSDRLNPDFSSLCHLFENLWSNLKSDKNIFQELQTTGFRSGVIHTLK